MITLPMSLAMLRHKMLYKGLIRYNKNNKKTISYTQEGFDILRPRVESLPDEIAFRPKFINQSSCMEIYDKLYVFISKANLYKSQDTKFDALFHEIGHWLHFQNLLPKEEAEKIWSMVNIENIRKKVSERATKGKDGRELVAEVFKFRIKGKTFDDEIMKLYELLNGPKIRD